MTSVELKNPAQIENLTSQKSKSLATSYRTFKRQVITQEQQLTGKQTEKLQQFIEDINQVNSKLSTIRSECEDKHKKLLSQIEEHQQKLDGYLTGQQNLEFQETTRTKIAEEKRQFIKNCQERVRTAESIDYKILKNVDIQERKSTANELFKWILVAMYIEPENKYYWPNFHKQVLSEVQALEDLKERLGKINAFNAKEQQRVKTRQFIEIFEKVKAAPQLKQIEKQVDKFFKIAQIFQECCQIGKRIKEYEVQIQKNQKKQAQESDELQQRRRECDALLQKKKIEELYLNQLKTIQESLKKKLSAYEKQNEQAKLYLGQLSNMTSEVTLVTVPDPSKQEVREKCECSLY